MRRRWEVSLSKTVAGAATSGAAFRAGVALRCKGRSWAARPGSGEPGRRGAGAARVTQGEWGARAWLSRRLPGPSSPGASGDPSCLRVSAGTGCGSCRRRAVLSSRASVRIPPSPAFSQECRPGSRLRPEGLQAPQGPEDGHDHRGRGVQGEWARSRCAGPPSAPGASSVVRRRRAGLSW